MYRGRGGRLEQVTQDHSLLQELVGRGFYSPEEAQRAAAKNYVTRALGVEPRVDVEITEQPDRKTTFTCCVPTACRHGRGRDIHLTINTFGANLGTVAKQLVLLANDNGGRDNISVVIVRVLDAFPAKRGVIDRIRKIFG